jgi:hypothetical protein
MEYLIICTVSLFVSGLTLFSGFGLGTLLMPAFTLFFPVPVAIAVTAVVHLANNLFKVVLVGRTADWSVVLRFALPGAMAAMVGASVLNIFTHFPPVFHYQLAGRIHQVGAVELVIGMLIVGFAMLDLMPRFSNVGFDRKYLVVGGALSGFLGGISGIQGALRSAFLIKAGLEKEAFIGTSTVSAVIVDLARLVVYGVSFYTIRFTASANMGSLMLAAIVAAFAGSFVGARLLKKVTMRMIQIVVGALLIVVGCGIATGLF